MVEKFQSPLMRFRTLRGITQQELADAMGVSRTTVMNWETGRAIPKLTIWQIKTLCKTLQITLEQVPDDFGPQPIHDTTKTAGLEED